jgi:branched-chain amino acid transport system substrate-binding protein
MNKLMNVMQYVLKPAIALLVLASVLPAAAQEVRVVRLGLTVSETGEFRDQSASYVNGIRFWAADLEERGANVIKLVTYDDESNAERAAELYERLITEDQVDLLIGPFSSTLALAVAPVAERHNFPMLVEATAPKLFEQGYRNVFGIYTPADQNMLGVLDMAVNNGLRTVAIAHQQSEFPSAVAAGVRDTAGGKGLSVVFDDSYPVGADNLDDLVKRLAATQPDLIIVGAYVEDAIKFMQSLKKTGYAPKMLAMSGAPASAEFGDVLGSDADGVIATTQWMRDGRIPGSFDFGYRYRQRYGRYPSYNAAGGYAAGQILEAAARLAGISTDDGPEAMRNGMRKQLASMKFQSLLGNYRVTESGEQIGNPIYIVQWQYPYRSLIAPEDIARWTLKFPFPSWSGR